MILLMAGLPGTGKSALARELAKALEGVILDKDVVRAALFAPHEIEYSTQQDDFVMEVMLEAASYYLRKDPKRVIILDGRPFVYAYQVQEVLTYANLLNQPVKIIQCICKDETARSRLVSSSESHLAANRNFDLYLKLQAAQEPLPGERITIDTDQAIDECVRVAREGLNR